MPWKFHQCVNQGGRVRTKSVKPGVSIKICYPRGGGAGIAGHVHHSQAKKSGSSHKARSTRVKHKSHAMRVHKVFHKASGGGGRRVARKR